jgi:hypothetical protein
MTLRLQVSPLVLPLSSATGSSLGEDKILALALKSAQSGTDFMQDKAVMIRLLSIQGDFL